MIVAPLILLIDGTEAMGYRASKVWFKFLSNGKMRVITRYTIPELRESRETSVEFYSRKKAEAYYWQLVKGGEFYPPKPANTRFPIVPLGPSPW